MAQEPASRTEITPPRNIPPGYHQAVVTAITAMIAFSLGFLLFWTIQSESGEWTPAGVLAAVVLAIGTVILFTALYRSLSVRDDEQGHYNTTVTVFFTGISTVAIAILLGVLAMMP